MFFSQEEISYLIIINVSNSSLKDEVSMKQKLQSTTFLFVLMILFAGFLCEDFAQTQRNPVLEEVTGTWCQWCPCGHDIMAEIKASMPNAIMIGYHGPMNSSNDPFSFFPGNTIISSFGFSAYPTAVIDRVSGIQSRSAWAGLMNTRNSVQATVSIEMERSFNEQTREFNATIDFTALTNLNGQFKFNVILQEDGIVWSQTGNSSCPGSPTYVHKHVVRDMINGALGEEIVNGAWNANDVITKTISHVVPTPTGSVPDMVWDSCNVVVLVYKVGSPLASGAEIQQAIEMVLKSPDYVATINSLSSDIIDDTNSPSEFTTVLHNEGLMPDSYTIGTSFDGPSEWTGNFTTVNGTFNFGETDIVQVGVGDSTVISVKLNPNGYNGSGMATVEFESQNNPGMVGSTTVRLVTIYGTDILVVDASGAGYGDYVTNSVGDVFSGTVGTVGSSALTPSTDLNNFQMIAWTAGVKLPVFKPDQVDALQTYLDNGGKLFIHGQDIGADVFGAGGQSQFAQAFYNNYLHASFVGNGTSYLINGIPGDPIGNGIQFVINDIYTRSPDNISPYDGNASSVFQYLNGPNIAGIKAAANDYKVVYFGIGFEQVPDVATRDTLASRIINYFGFQPMQLPSAPILVNPANAQTVDSSSVMFEWEQTQPQASKYWLELDTSSQFTNPVVESDITETTYLYTGLVANQTYYWRVRGWSENGWGNFSEVYSFNTLFTGIENENTQMPYSFNLGQNYPNPFNPTTQITYSVPEEVPVNLTVYDMLGRKVAELVNERQHAGEYELQFNASSLASGTYIYKLSAGDFVSVRKMTLLK